MTRPYIYKPKHSEISVIQYSDNNSDTIDALVRFLTQCRYESFYDYQQNKDKYAPYISIEINKKTSEQFIQFKTDYLCTDIYVGDYIAISYYGRIFMIDEDTLKLKYEKN